MGLLLARTRAARRPLSRVARGVEPPPVAHLRSATCAPRRSSATPRTTSAVRLRPVMPSSNKSRSAMASSPATPFIEGIPTQSVFPGVWVGGTGGGTRNTSCLIPYPTLLGSVTQSGGPLHLTVFDTRGYCRVHDAAGGVSARCHGCRSIVVDSGAVFLRLCRRAGKSRVPGRAVTRMCRWSITRRLCPGGQGQPGGPARPGPRSSATRGPRSGGARPNRAFPRSDRPPVGLDRQLPVQQTLTLPWGAWPNPIIRPFIRGGGSRSGAGSGQRIRSSANVLAESILRAALRSSARFRWPVKYPKSPHAKERLAGKGWSFPGSWAVLSRRNGRMTMPRAHSSLMFP